MNAVSSRDKVLGIFQKHAVDGTGLIARCSLTRVLQQVNQQIFTEENISILLGDTSSSSSENVRIEDFVDSVYGPGRYGGEAPNNQASSKALNNRALDAYIDALVCDIRGFKEAINIEAIVQATGNSPHDLERLKEDLKYRSKEYMLASQRKNIRPLWHEWDLDKNGVLSLEECGYLVVAYLQGFLSRLEDIIRGCIVFGIELSLAVYEKQIKDANTRGQMRAQAQVQVDLMYAQVTPRIREQVTQKMQNEDPRLIASQLLENLDLNGDGKVTQDEFEIQFAEAMHHVLGPERFMEKHQLCNS